MTDALISEAKRSPVPGPADSETRKEVFIACIHRPGFDSCVPNILISEKNSRRYDSDYNLQRNWPLLKIIGCFECKKEARAAIDISFYAMKTEGVVDPRASLFKMRSEDYPWVEDQCNEYTSDDDDFDDERFIPRDDDHFDDERYPLEKAFKLVDSQKGAPALWSIFPFDMQLTLWTLSEVFIVSGQYNWSTNYGGDEEIDVHGVFQGAVEARTALDIKAKETKGIILRDFDESDREDDPPSEEFPAKFLKPEKDITENWHADGTGCMSFHVKSYDQGCGVDRASLRVQKVPNIPVSTPMKLMAAVKSYLDTLVWLELCNSQGNAMFSFVRLPLRMRHPFAGARVNSMSLTQGERLRVVGCGFKGELVRLLSLGMSRRCEPQRKASHKMMMGIALRIAARLFSAASVDSKSQSEKRARRAEDREAEKKRQLNWWGDK